MANANAARRFRDTLAAKCAQHNTRVSCLVLGNKSAPEDSTHVNTQ